MFKKDRSPSVTDQSQRLDMEYQEEVNTPSFLQEHLNYQLYELGERRYVTNLMEKQEGDTRIQVFDYRYVEKVSNRLTGSMPEVEGNFRQGVCRITDPKMDLPDFLIRPEGSLESLFGFLDRTDIDFLESPKFSKQYHLSGPHEGAIRQFFNDQILYLLAEHPGWYLEGLAGEFILVHPSASLSALDIQDFILLGMRLRGLFVEASKA